MSEHLPPIPNNEPSPRAKRLKNLLGRLYPHTDEMNKFDSAIVMNNIALDYAALNDIPHWAEKKIGLLFIKHCWDD